MNFKKVILYLLSLAAIALTTSFFCRDLLLNYFLKEVSEKVRKNYGADLIIKKSCFMGMSEILLKDISFVSPDQDTLLGIERLELKPAYVNLLLGQTSYKRLSIANISVHLVSNDSTSNYSFLTRKKNQENIKQTESNPEYGSKLNNLINRVFSLITGETEIKNFHLSYLSSHQDRKYEVPEFSSDGKAYHCQVFNLSQADTIKWLVNGNISKADRAIKFSMIRESPNATMVSLTGDEKSFKWLIDTLEIEGRGLSYQKGELTIGLNGNFKNLQVNHWRISPEDVSIPSGEIDFIIHIGENYIQADTISTLKINSLKCNIGAGYEKDKNHTYSININTGKIPSTDLFESLPHGMFNTLQGIKTKGEISYYLDFSLIKEIPDSLIFNSELKKYNFAITRFGNEYFPKINGEFNYTAYDGDRPVRNFQVGPSNPNFTPLNQISTFLQYAVMTSEDGAFLYHGGFNEEAFRQSIATNIKEGRFARGGSTISMQLVKNVYLSRNKTVSRKLEEALIVWLIERNRLVTKERMLEVYLNVIEWGPNVYGIGEASRFYFSKSPSQLTLAESIYLASIIPHPKFFKYSFDETGQLKPFLKGFYRLVSDRMLKKNWITPADTIQLQPNITLNGEALKYVLPLEMLPTDILPPEEIEIFN